ncbi:iroquois-class homeodomain protein IRX-5-like isoform X2 [Crotalus tigris]|nr:iroquois-class homeodomain protein IRX-5-like isoform X2 [Crotalus tigris]XP_039198351.1 iroquois-class homeodomain protein IRX-5-like isoform X2 [Crotalus tigris]
MPPLGSPFLCAAPPEDPRWGKAAAWRESTGALRAWLGQHLQNPYPSKGEKILLAVLSQRSLSQVSTWFANARRRLKKENRLRSGPRLLTASGEEEEEEEEEKGQAGGQQADSGGSPQAPWGGSRAGGPGRDPDPLASLDRAEPERSPPGPRLWSVAEPAPHLVPGRPPQWGWGLRPLRTLASGLWEHPSCAPGEGRGEGPPLGSEPWGPPEESRKRRRSALSRLVCPGGGLQSPALSAGMSAGRADLWLRTSGVCQAGESQGQQGGVCGRGPSPHGHGRQPRDGPSGQAGRSSEALGGTSVSQGLFLSRGKQSEGKTLLQMSTGVQNSWEAGRKS